ncbi:MAG: acetate--CoA ligase family protein [Desulfotomaculales bacterium]
MPKVDLELFFKPRSIAIIGASADLATISGKPLRYLTEHGYRGKIYPVNPKYKEIAGYPCYPSITEVSGPVDLALIAVNYKRVLPMLEQCAEKGVRFATIFSSGFAEAGEEGRALQRELAEFARRTGLRLCGPNCQGAVNLHDNIAAAFSASLDIKPFTPGSVGFVTQSGALGYSIFNLAQEAGVGFSYVVSTGNEVDLDCLDFMRYMLEDDNTRVVFTYLEGMRDGEKFARVADRALELGKPLAVLKVGRSETGSKAASSHTAALTGSDQVYDAFFGQKGIIRVGDIEEFIDLARLINGGAKFPRGKRLGIITTSGGAGVLAADTAEECGLQVPPLQEETRRQILTVIPAYGSALNPVDVTAQVISEAEGFWKVLQAMVDDPGIDALAVVITMITGASGLRMAQDVAKMSRLTEKPLAVAWTAGDRLMGECFAVLREAGVTWYKSPVRCVKALARLMHYGTFREQWRQQTAASAGRISLADSSVAGVPAAVREILSGAGKVLSERESKAVLSAFGIPVTREETARTQEEALSIAGKIGYPVALKVDSPDILHKTEAGAIRLGVSGDRELREAFAEVLANARRHSPEARINGVLVQEMVPPGGVEVIVGVKSDPQFGPVVVFGLGGIFVEILKDVARRVAPLSPAEARAMIREIRGFGLLAGARGRAKADVEALAEVLVKVAGLALVLKDELAELDINPLIVLPAGKGVKVADALLIRKG